LNTDETKGCVAKPIAIKNGILGMAAVKVLSSLEHFAPKSA
jgi:hypothetical protein